MAIALKWFIFYLKKCKQTDENTINVRTKQALICVKKMEHPKLQSRKIFVKFLSTYQSLRLGPRPLVDY